MIEHVVLNVGPKTYSFFSTGNDNFFVTYMILTGCPKKQKREKRNKCEYLIHSIGLCIHTMSPLNIDFRLHCLEQNFYRSNYFKSFEIVFWNRDDIDGEYFPPTIYNRIHKIAEAKFNSYYVRRIPKYCTFMPSV